MSGRKAIPGCWRQNDSSRLDLFSCCSMPTARPATEWRRSRNVIAVAVTVIV